MELGVRYLARDNNRHAKAGNLNNGLAHSEGEFIVVFDADHVPARDFLQETVGYFGTDEKLFLVQTPHFFLNKDPIERNLSAIGMPAENEMFYSVVQKGLDKWNAAFFCGSAAVLRRAGARAGRRLPWLVDHRGRRERARAPLARLEQPLCRQADDRRAAARDLRILHRPTLALVPRHGADPAASRTRSSRAASASRQRLCYLSSSMFWLFPLSRMIFIFAPMLYIFFNMKIYIANSQEFLAYTLTYMISATMIQSYVFGRVRWPWTSDLYEYIQSVMLFRAVLGVFVDPRRPKFNVTAKGQTLEENQVSSIALPYFVIFGLVLVSLVVLGIRFVNEPNARDLISVVGVWSCLNLVLTGISLGAVCELRERRPCSADRQQHAGHPRVERRR